MNKSRLLLITSIFLISIVFLPVFPTQVHASILDNFKNFFNQGEDKNVKNKEFTIDSQIELVPEGDEDKDGEIDAGDIIRFTYTLRNTTDQKYSFATLKTNIDRKLINHIHNIRGSTGIIETDNTVSIPNFRIGSNEQRVISFDAIINYYQEDKVITTEPEFISFEKKSLAKSLRKEIKATKLSAEEVYKRGFAIKKDQ
ncbi:hypothetical protein HYW54_05050 [Candidatus Gottesmanbacteria bacterium]|nr:hypothetical protein [Candidatus Gottesmanbacteria bacterium]